MASDSLIAFPQTKSLGNVMLPSIGNMVFVSLLFVLAFHSGQGLLGDGDTGYHIRTGELILKTWRVPTEDPYSFHYPPLKWTAHEWLSEVMMAAVFRITGLTGVVLFFAFLFAIIHWFLYQSLRSRSDDIFLCVMITLVATATSSTHWLARPHAFSLLFALLTYHWLDRFQYKNQNALIYLPLLMLVWVNLHGGFIIGLVLLLVYFVGNICSALTSSARKSVEHARKAKSLGIIFLAAVAACVINPHGVNILWFPIRVTSDRFIMDRVTEFLSPNFHDVLPFKYMLLAMIGAFALSRSALNVIEVMLAVLLTYMTLYSARHVSLFAIVVAPILLKSMENILRQSPDTLLNSYRKRASNLLATDRSLKGVLWPATGIVFVLGLLLSGSIEYGFDAKKFPVGAVEFLRKERISGNMFNNDEFGDYLIFAAPDYRVFMDGRSDMYGEKYGSDYLRVANALPGWKNVLEKYDITWVLFDTKSPLVAALSDQLDWKAIYVDQVATVMVKSIPAHKALIKKYALVSLPST